MFRVFRDSLWVLSCAVMIATSSLAGAQRQQWSVGMNATLEQAAEPKIPAYEVVSIRRHKSDFQGMTFQRTPDGFRAVNIGLLMLISDAYGIGQDMITGGPSWVTSMGFDTQAKVAASDVNSMQSLNAHQEGAMLRAVLSERFGLKVHTESRMMPAFELVVSQKGPRLTPTQSPIPAGTSHNPIYRPGEYADRDVPMSALAGVLSTFCKRPVVDKTALTGRYDIALKWNAQEMAGLDSSEGTLPSLYTAIEEQLGLKLKSATAPRDVLVIDHVELPSEN